MSHWTDDTAERLSATGVLQGAMANQTAVKIPMEGWIPPSQRLKALHMYVPGSRSMVFWWIDEPLQRLTIDDGFTTTHIYPDGRIESMVKEDLERSFDRPLHPVGPCALCDATGRCLLV